MVRQVHDQGTRGLYARLVPPRRYGAPEEVASVAVLLASGGFAAAGIAAVPGQRAAAQRLPQEAEATG